MIFWTQMFDPPYTHTHLTHGPMAAVRLARDWLPQLGPLFQKQSQREEFLAGLVGLVFLKPGVSWTTLDLSHSGPSSPADGTLPRRDLRSRWSCRAWSRPGRGPCWPPRRAHGGRDRAARGEEERFRTSVDFGMFGEDSGWDRGVDPR